MKLMIWCVLCAAVCQAAGRYGGDEDNEAAPELHDGNFGLKLKASLDTATVRPVEENIQIQEGPPEKEYLPPEKPVPKISDALAGAEHTFSSAIESHLKSPLPVYRPRLGSPTTFDASPLSYLTSYSKQHKYQLPESLPFFPTFGTTEGPAKLTSFPAFTQTTTQKTLPIEDPKLTGEFKPLPEVSQLLYQQLFSTEPDTDPRNIYHEINQLQTLSDQVPNEENVQIIRDEKEKDNEYAKELNKLAVGEDNINQGYTRRLEYSTTIRPQLYSYAQFSQGLPLASRKPIITQPETVELQKTQSPFTFEPTSTRVTSLPVVTTSSPRPPLFTTTQTPPPRNRVVKIGQRVTTPRSLTFSTKISPAYPPLNYESTRSTLSTYSFPFGTRTSLFRNTVTPRNNFKASSTKVYRTTLSPIPHQSVQTPSTLPIYSLKAQSPVTTYSTPLPTFQTPSTLLLASQPDLIPTTISQTPLSSTVIISSPSESTSQTLQQSTTAQPLPILLLSTKTDSSPQTYESTTTPLPIIKIEESRKESKPKEQQNYLIEDLENEALIPTKQHSDEIKQDFELIREGPQSLQPVEQSIIIQNEDTVQTIPQEITVLDNAHTIIHPNQLISFSPLYQQPHILQQELYQPQPLLTQYTTQTQHLPIREPQKTINFDKQQKQPVLVKDQSLKQISHSPPPQYNPIDLRHPFLQNNVYTEEQDYYYVNPPYLPVPVGITSFSSPILQGPGSFSHALPPYPGHTYHDTPTAVSAVQYYSKFAPDVFGHWH